MQNTLAIKKVIGISFAFAIKYWKKILAVSIIPVIIAMPFLSILPDVLVFVEIVLEGGNVDYQQLPSNTLIYLFLFFYGYILLSINVYRLVVLGADAVSSFALITDFVKILKFVGLIFFVAIVTEFPTFLTGYKLLYLIVYFLIMPLTLNFINIAIGEPFQFKYKLPFVVHLNLFFLQLVLPILATVPIAYLVKFIGFGVILSLIIKIILIYWTLISLAVCYRLVTFDNLKKTHDDSAYQK